ncbi:hypothetical protein QQ045_008816 [Rhodiola kirilowii]
MQSLHRPSIFTPTNVACSSPITTNPNPNPTTTFQYSAPKSPMADSSPPPTVSEAGANKENIRPLTGLAANSVVLPKRRRFVRKPLTDITNQFKQRNSSCVGLSWSFVNTDDRKTVKRKADLSDCDGAQVKLSCRSNTLRMNFR